MKVINAHLVMLGSLLR